MKEPLKLMAVLAHPDDESLGLGGILAKYAVEGVETSLVRDLPGHGHSWRTGLVWAGGEAYWQQVWQAITCHRSQLPGYEALGHLPQAMQRTLWSTHSFYRALSLVNGGRQVERDLFEGLR